MRGTRVRFVRRVRSRRCRQNRVAVLPSAHREDYADDSDTDKEKHPLKPFHRYAAPRRKEYQRSKDHKNVFASHADSIPQEYSPLPSIALRRNDDEKLAAHLRRMCLEMLHEFCCRA